MTNLEHGEQFKPEESTSLRNSKKESKSKDGIEILEDSLDDDSDSEKKNRRPLDLIRAKFEKNEPPTIRRQRSEETRRDPGKISRTITDLYGEKKNKFAEDTQDGLEVDEENGKSIGKKIRNIYPIDDQPADDGFYVSPRRSSSEASRKSSEDDYSMYRRPDKYNKIDNNKEKNVKKLPQSIFGIFDKKDDGAKKVRADIKKPTLPNDEVFNDESISQELKKLSHSIIEHYDKKELPVNEEDKGVKNLIQKYKKDEENSKKPEDNKGTKGFTNNYDIKTGTYRPEEAEEKGPACNMDFDWKDLVQDEFDDDDNDDEAEDEEIFRKLAQNENNGNNSEIREQIEFPKDAIVIHIPSGTRIYKNNNGSGLTAIVHVPDPNERYVKKNNMIKVQLKGSLILFIFFNFFLIKF